MKRCRLEPKRSELSGAAHGVQRHTTMADQEKPVEHETDVDTNDAVGHGRVSFPLTTLNGMCIVS